VRPKTAVGLAVEVAVILPGVETAVKYRTADPPFDAGVKLTVAL
jgi:hypothetical protein